MELNVADRLPDLVPISVETGYECLSRVHPPARLMPSPFTAKRRATHAVHVP